MIRWLVCGLFGHLDGESESDPFSQREVCPRCNAILNRELTYKGEAREWLRRARYGHGWEPKEIVTDAKGKEMRPGDYVAWFEPSAFPGLQREKNGPVKYIFETPSGERQFVTKFKREPLSEAEIIGFKPRDEYLKNPRVGGLRA